MKNVFLPIQTFYQLNRLMISKTKELRKFPSPIGYSIIRIAILQKNHDLVWHEFHG